MFEFLKPGDLTHFLWYLHLPIPMCVIIVCFKSNRQSFLRDYVDSDITLKVSWMPLQLFCGVAKWIERGGRV